MMENVEKERRKLLSSLFCEAANEGDARIKIICP